MACGEAKDVRGVGDVRGERGGKDKSGWTRLALSEIEKEFYRRAGMGGCLTAGDQERGGLGKKGNAKKG